MQFSSQTLRANVRASSGSAERGSASFRHWSEAARIIVRGPGTWTLERMMMVYGDNVVSSRGLLLASKVQLLVQGPDVVARQAELKSGLLS